MTAVAPHTAFAPRPIERSPNAPLPVRELPPELLDIDLDVVHPEDEPDTGPSPDLLLRCSAIFGSIIAAALLAGEIVALLA